MVFLFASRCGQPKPKLKNDCISGTLKWCGLAVGLMSQSHATAYPGRPLACARVIPMRFRAGVS
eukprot:scaffold659237_cov59-Prasinocladus_malaysianus.AAC.1